MNEIEDIVNKQLLKDQEFLELENNELKQYFEKLNHDYLFFQKNSIEKSKFNELEKNINEIKTLNDYLKVKIKNLTRHPKHLNENNTFIVEFQGVLKKLDFYGEFCKNPQKLIELTSDLSTVSSIITELKVQLEIAVKKRKKAEQDLFNYDANSEYLLLRENLTTIQKIISELDVMNLKEKLKTEQLEEDKGKLLVEINKANNKLQNVSKKYENSLVQMENLKLKLSECEKHQLEFKKELNGNLNIINKAKRAVIDAEIKLQNVRESQKHK